MSLMFNFKMIHVPGVLNKVADTASRFPGKERLVEILQLGASSSDIAEIEEIESLEKSISAELASTEICQAITHDRDRKGSAVNKIDGQVNQSWRFRIEEFYRDMGRRFGGFQERQRRSRSSRRCALL